MSLMRVLTAEPMKFRRSMVTYLTFGVPIIYLGLIVLFLGYSILSHRGEHFYMDTETPWQAAARMFDTPWIVLVVPFGVVILAALATQNMHANRMWSFVSTQPASRSALYLAQLIGVMGLVLLGMMFVGLGYLVIGLLFRFGVPVDWGLVLGRPLLAWTATFPILALQVWLGTRFSSFALPITIGVAGVVISIILRALGLWFISLWAFPYLVIEQTAQILFLSLGLGLLFTLLGLIDFNRQEQV